MHNATKMIGVLSLIGASAVWTCPILGRRELIVASQVNDRRLMTPRTLTQSRARRYLQYEFQSIRRLDQRLGRPGFGL